MSLRDLLAGGFSTLPSAGSGALGAEGGGGEGAAGLADEPLVNSSDDDEPWEDLQVGVRRVRGGWRIFR